MRINVGDTFTTETTTTYDPGCVPEIIDLMHRQLDIIEKLFSAHIIIPSESGEPR